MMTKLEMRITFQLESLLTSPVLSVDQKKDILKNLGSSLTR